VETANTCDRSVDVERIFVDHRLDDNGVVAADNYAPYGDWTGLAAMDRCIGA
jgi:hypothetical protein